jgi:hypothetical protein
MASVGVGLLIFRKAFIAFLKCGPGHANLRDEIKKDTVISRQPVTHAWRKKYISYKTIPQQSHAPHTAHFQRSVVVLCADVGRQRELQQDVLGPDDVRGAEWNVL